MKSSLTTPADESSCTDTVIDRETDPLPRDECKRAVNVLNITPDKLDFTVREKAVCDPSIDQKVCLVSFTPAKGATPDEDGYYGMMKVRGAFTNNDEATDRSTDLIKNHDSYNPIFHAEVGKPFPITDLTKFAKHVRDHNLDEKSQETYDNIKKLKNDEKKAAITEREEREKLMNEQVRIANTDDKDLNPEELRDKYLEKYISYRLVFASNLERYLYYAKAMEELTANIIASSSNIKKLNESNSYYQNNYKNKLFEVYKESMKVSPSFQKYFEINTDTDFEKILINGDDFKTVVAELEEHAVIPPAEPKKIEEIADEESGDANSEDIENEIEKEVQGIPDEESTLPPIVEGGEDESKSGDDTTPAPVVENDTTPAPPPPPAEDDETKGDDECNA